MDAWTIGFYYQRIKLGLYIFRNLIELKNSTLISSLLGQLTFESVTNSLLPIGRGLRVKVSILHKNSRHSQLLFYLAYLSCDYATCKKRHYNYVLSFCLTEVLIKRHLSKRPVIIEYVSNEYCFCPASKC